MQAFDAVFPELARREARVVQTMDHRGKPTGVLLFREIYCDVPRCDCRRVMIEVEWLDGDKVVATIGYDFDKRRGEPQVGLLDDGPQSEASDELLAMFREMIGEGTYRKTLMAHYALWKRAIDDPAHPAHAKARPKRRKQPRQPKPPMQPGLQRLATQGTRASSKVQQRFARMIKKVEQQKQRLRGWHDARPAISRELATNEARFATHRQLGRELVCLLDRQHGDPIFSKPDRKRIAAIVCELARELLVAEPYDDVKAIYNLHSRGDFDREWAQEQTADAEEMKAAMEEMFGIDLGEADLSSVETVKAHADEVLRGIEQADADARERRKTPKQQAKEFRREAERQQVGKALQEIYRKLAVALHPDLEQDATERARKTELMQQVNAAYEAKDLLKLLELQLELEQVDPDKLDAIAEDRLQRYNTILDDQFEQLAEELHELELPFRMELDLPPPARLEPGMVLARLRADALELEQRTAALRRDLATFADVTRLKAWLKASATRPRRRDRDLYG